jgi:hypothetical protein
VLHHSVKRGPWIFDSGKLEFHKCLKSKG